MKKVNKHFVSEIDKKLAKFNQSHTKSASQEAEIDKYRRIFEKRDDPKARIDDQGGIWD